MMKHIAGPVICPDGDLVIQRCACCGFALLKVRCSETARTVSPDEGTSKVAVFAVGDIVEVEGTNPITSLVVGNITERDDPMGRCDDVEELCISEELK